MSTKGSTTGRPPSAAGGTRRGSVQGELSLRGRAPGAPGASATLPSVWPASVPPAVAAKEQAREAKRREDEVSQQYISNLQQQVYFLELQMKLMKKKNRKLTEELRAATGTDRPGEGGDGPALGINKADPLDKVLSGLQSKYADMQSSFQARLDEAAAAREDAENRLKKTVIERERLRNELERARHECEDGQGRARADTAELLRRALEAEAERDTLREKLASRTKDLESLTERTRSEVMALRVEVLQARDGAAATQQQLRDVQAQLEGAKSRGRKLEVDLVEMTDSDANVRRIREQAAEVTALRSERSELQQAVRRLETAAERAAADVAELKRENGDLRRAALDAQAELADGRRRLDDDDRRGQTWSERLVDLRMQNEELRSALDRLPERMQEAQARLDQLRREQTETVLRVEEATRERQEAERVRDAAAARAAALEEKLRVLTREHRLEAQGHSSKREESARLRQELEAVQQERDSLQHRVETLEARKQMDDALGNLDLGSIQSMAATNMRMAATIQSLMAGMEKHERVSGSGQAKAAAPVSVAAEVPSATAEAWTSPAGTRQQGSSSRKTGGPAARDNGSERDKRDGRTGSGVPALRPAAAAAEITRQWADETPSAAAGPTSPRSEGLGAFEDKEARQQQQQQRQRQPQVDEDVDLGASDQDGDGLDEGFSIGSHGLDGPDADGAPIDGFSVASPHLDASVDVARSLAAVSLGSIASKGGGDHVSIASTSAMRCDVASNASLAVQSDFSRVALGSDHNSL